MSRRSLRARTSTPSYAIKLDIGEDDDEILEGSSDEDEQLAAAAAASGPADAAMADDAAPQPAPESDDDGVSVASTLTRGRTPSGRVRGGRGRGRAAARGGGAARARRAGSDSSGSDFAPPSQAGSAGGASEEEDDDDSDAYSSDVDSMRAVSDDGSIGSDLELSARRGGGRRASGRSSSVGTSASKPGVVKSKQKRKHAGAKSRQSGSYAEERKREDIWTFSEGNAPLVPHYSSHLLAPPSLRARSSVARTDVPQRPMRIEEVTGRVRTFTSSIHGMTPWDAWGGEGWRPDSAAQAADGESVDGERRRNGWEGVEKGWSGLQVVTAERAARYLPVQADAPPTKLLAGHLTPSSPQIVRELPVLSSSPLASHNIRKTGCIFNPGGPVWSVDWCPMTEEESEKRDWKLYLAVAAHSSLDADAPLGHTKHGDTLGSIQIWSVAPTAELRAKDPPSRKVRKKAAPSEEPPAPPKRRRSSAADPETARLEKNRKAAEKRQQKKAEDAANGTTPKKKGKGKAKQEPAPEEIDELADTEAPASDVPIDEPHNGTAPTAADGPAGPPALDKNGGPAPELGSSSHAAAGEPQPSPDPGPAAAETVAATSESAPKAAPEADVEMEDEAEGGSDVDEAEWDMETRLAMVVCFNGGQPCRLQWCPSDSSDPLHSEAGSMVPKLGVLAGTFEDGTVKLFAVPDPDAVRASQGSKDDGPLYVLLEPLTVLEVDDAALLSLDWGSDRILATGSSHGRIATWDIKGLAHSGEDDPLPLALLQAHEAPIRALRYVRAPQADAIGTYRFDWEQHLVVSTANNRILLTDLRENESIGLPLRLGRSASLYAAAASVQNGTVIAGDGDYQAYMFAMRPRGLGMGRRTAGHQGSIWSLSTSDYHPNLASAGADGTLLVTNTLRGTSKNRGSWISLMEPVYRMDKNEKTGELRMLDNLLPQNLNTQISLKSQSAVGAKRSFSDKALKDLNGRHAVSQAWAPDVGVLSAAWNSGGGIGRAGLLASGMACGLARVDVLVDGRWRPGVGRTRAQLVERLREKKIFL